MKRVSHHLGLVTSTFISNIWLLTDPSGRRFLVDTGHYVDRLLLRQELWRQGIRHRGDLSAILLTHRHSDHAGNAAWLRKLFGCPIICHSADAEFLSGKKKAQVLARGQARLHEEFICYFEDFFPTRCSIDEVFEEGKWKWGFQIIPVPGHTDGSVLLYHEPTTTLFSGDAILSGIPPFRFLGEHLSLSIEGFSEENERCHHHVREFLKRLPQTEFLCAGHGPAVDSNTHQKLLKLLEKKGPKTLLRGHKSHEATL